MEKRLTLKKSIEAFQMHGNDWTSILRAWYLESARSRIPITVV
jgi:hypothetical protein